MTPPVACDGPGLHAMLVAFMVLFFLSGPPARHINTSSFMLTGVMVALQPHNGASGQMLEVPIGRQKQLDAARGALIGGMCGDAAGAVLEFVNGYNEQDARKALTMPGGGVWRVGPGQRTDDTELMLALLHGLRGQDPFKGFPAQTVASRYQEWYQSGPFDIGNTCRNAFSVPDPSQMEAVATKLNMATEANGALMRAGPIAVWCVLRGVTDSAIVAAYARADSRLSHPSQVCQDANAMFSVALAHLIRHPGDSAGAVLAVEALARNEPIHPTVLSWWEDSKAEGILRRQCKSNMGHAKYGFTLAMHLLRLDCLSYEDSILKVLMLRGDTDTNACIVGYIMGALRGVAGIPEYMKSPVLAFDCTRPGRGIARPEVYNATWTDTLVAEMWRGDSSAQQCF